MSYSKKSLCEWQEELKYLANVYQSKRIPANFNNNFDCFLSYVKMQSNFAFRDGFPGVCFQMRIGFNVWAGKEQFTKTECGLPENELCKTCNCILCGWRFDKDAPLDCEDYSPKDDKPNP